MSHTTRTFSSSVQEPNPTTDSVRRAWVERVWLGLMCLIVGGFYAWTVGTHGKPWSFGDEQRDYYNLLIDGYLEGQLHMKAKIPPALLAVKNPYDPAERPPGLALHDASYYKGKYYVYFGAAPMVTLMLPFRVVTGVDLPLPAAILVFVYGGFLASVAVWLAVRRRYFAETSTLVASAGVLILGLAGVGAVLLRRPDMWELPIAGGYCFAMLALGCVWRSLHTTRQRAAWYASAGLCLGLAIASRPTYLIASPFLAVPLVVWWWPERRAPWRPAVGAALSLAAIGGAMAWHNYARFDDPLEFGQAYQFSLDYESKLPHFSASYVPYNVEVNFLSRAQWTRYFPFIRRPDFGPSPAGFTQHRGDVYGLLIHFPIVWLATLAGLALWRRRRDERTLLAAWIGTVAVLLLLTTTVLLFFFSALARYQMDFVPGLLLLTAVGLLGLERWLRLSARLWLAVVARTGWVIAAVVSVGFGILYSLQFEGILAEENPRMERKVARALNRIPAWFERLVGVEQGPLEISFRLPAERRTGQETLFTSGQTGRADRGFVRYLDDGRVRLGVVPFGGVEQVSRPLRLDPKKTHRLHVALGSLYPPAAHPFFAGKTDEEVRRAKRRVVFELNGELVLVGEQRSEYAVPGPVEVGRVAAAAAAYPNFGGEVLASERTRLAAAEALEDEDSFVRVRLAFPEAISVEREPMIAWGEQSGVMLTAAASGAGHVQLGLVTSSETLGKSQPIVVIPGRAQEWVVRVIAGRDPASRRVCVWLDQDFVWATEIRWPEVSTNVIAGRNVIGAADCRAEFGGRIFSLQHDAVGRDPLLKSGNMWRLRVRFPTDRMSKREPLIVTGCTGVGNVLIVEYLGDGVRFGLDHWGAAMRYSQPVKLDLTQPHDIDVTMTILTALEPSTPVRAVQERRLEAKVDGVGQWDETVHYYGAEPDEITIGRNPIGGTSSEPRFTGEILQAERIARE